jgi:hypothetical protein
MNKEIHKKTISSMFIEVMSGNKSFDLRLADWQCEPGDILILDEIDDVTKIPTGRSIRKRVGYILNTQETRFFSKKEIEKYGLQVISLLEENKS